MRWILVEAMDRVLPEIDIGLAEYALRELRSRGIDIRLGTTLEEVSGDCGAHLDRRDDTDSHRGLDSGRRPESDAASSSALPLDERGRIVVDDHLHVQGEDGVWAIGDSAAVPDPARPGRPCPPTSQHAIRQGRTVARNVAAIARRRQARAVHLPDDGPVREPRPVQGRRAASAVARSGGSRHGGWRARTT